MRICEIKKLRPGHRVWWQDPDRGICSRYYTIRTIRYQGGIVQLESRDDSYLECLARELTRLKPNET